MVSITRMRKGRDPGKPGNQMIYFFARNFQISNSCFFLISHAKRPFLTCQCVYRLSTACSGRESPIFFSECRILNQKVSAVEPNSTNKGLQYPLEMLTNLLSLANHLLESKRLSRCHVSPTFYNNGHLLFWKLWDKKASIFQSQTPLWFWLHNLTQVLEAPGTMAHRRRHSRNENWKPGPVHSAYPFENSETLTNGRKRRIAQSQHTFLLILLVRSCATIF